MSSQVKDDDGFLMRLALQNIVDRFNSKENPGEFASNFIKAAYQLYLFLKTKPKPTDSQILAEYEKLQQNPLTCGDIRELYG